MSQPAARRFEPRWFAYLAVAVVFAIACLLLSNWQFARRTEAANKVVLVAENYDAPPVPLTQLVPALDSFDLNATWHPVVAEGHYLTEYATLVRNRVQDNDAGFESLVPFELASGAVVVIDRGWTPANANARPAQDIVLPSSTMTTVTFRLRPSEAQIKGQESTAESIPTINISNLATRWANDTYSAIYGQLVSESPTVGNHGVLAEKPKLDEGNHLSYAFQWIAFAVLGFVALIWIVRRERQIAKAGRTTKPTRRKPSHDESEEDRLIDAQLPPRG